MRVQTLAITLTHFEQAISWLEASIEVAANRPTNVMRLQAIMGAAQAIEEATGRAIVVGWRKSGTDARDHFRGSEGKVLIDFMRMLEPKVSEAALVRDLRKARANRSQDKSGEML